MSRTITYANWVEEAIQKFGENPKMWKFVCPCCQHEAYIQDWIDAGCTENQAAFSCVGRYLKQPVRDAFKKGKGPCNYAGGGLFRLNPVTVKMPDGKEQQVFEFGKREGEK